MSTAQENRDQIYHGFQAQLKPAPLLKRFLASAIDYGIIGAATYVLVLIAMLFGGILFGGLFSATKLFSSDGAGIASTITLVLLWIYVAVFVIAIMAMYHGYFIYYEYKKGQTPGKKLFGLSVVTDDGSPRTKSKMVLREIFRYVDTLVVPGLICIAVTDKKQRIGDLMAGTFVAYSKTEERGSDFLYIKLSDYNYIYEVVQPNKDIDQNFMDEILKVAAEKFLSGFSDQDMQSTYLQDLERRTRKYFQNEDNKRVDGRTVLLFMAEHCYQLDIKLKMEQKG